jgi:hypothetical protein
MKRYHDEFPDAPQALLAGIAGACSIPSIFGARVGQDGSVYLDIFQGDYHINPNHLIDLAEFFEVDVEEIQIDAGPRSDTITVSVCFSNFDFSAQFREQEKHSNLPGVEDSEESVEALAALALARRS